MESHPLLKGAPGREFCVSETDGSAFVFDVETSPVIPHIESPDRQQWSQHPLAKSLALSHQEMASLGLILPADRSTREY